MATRQRITRIGVWQAGKIQAAVNAFLVLICGPFVALASLDHWDKPKKVLAAVGIALAVPVVGFVQGAIFAAVYNVAARWGGGLEVTVEEVEIAAVRSRVAKS